MVGQNFSQVGFVLRLDQSFDGACWQLGKGFVCRSEYGKRTLLLSVSTRPAALTAATSVVWSFELTAFSTMVLLGYIAAPPTITVSAAKLSVAVTERNAKQAAAAIFCKRRA